MIEQSAFHDGRYHLAQREKMRDIGYQNLHEETLQRSYRHSMGLVAEQGWRNPLLSKAPHVLQMGTAGAYTSSTFAEFVHDINPNACITVADFSEYPLRQSKAGMSWEPKVNFVRTDTTALSFADNSFDHIETDGLLQYLNSEQKTQAVAEWYRVLKPGGVVTTRDRFVSVNASSYEWGKIDELREYFYNEYGVYTYSTTTERMRDRFNTQGFSTLIEKTRITDPRMFLVHDIVAQKPEV